MNNNECRIIKIEKVALYEFIYENFIANHEEFMDMDAVGNIKNEKPEDIWVNAKSAKCRALTKSCKMYCRMLNCNFKHNFANLNKSFIQRCKNKLVKIFTGKR